MNDQLKYEIAKHLEKYPEAFAFLKSYGALCHALDDLVDRDNPEIADYKMFAVDTINLARDVFSCPFYQANIKWLYGATSNIHRVYAVSVAWEKELGWKGQYADIVRCFGNELITAMLQHVCHLPSSEVLRLDLSIREDAWRRHHDENGSPT